MYKLKRFHQDRFDRINAVIDELAGHLTGYVNLIGSATLPFPEVGAMQGLPGTAVRAEGFPGKRLFPGTDTADLVEEIIEDRLTALFDLESSYFVSGQPHSATQANQAVFRAVLPEAGGSVIGLSAVDGGHVSHRVGLPGGTDFSSFPMGSSGIDYDMLETKAISKRPDLIVAGGTSYTRAIDFPRLRQIADRSGAHLHGDIAHTAPFVLSGRHPAALPACDSLTLDTGKGLRGPRGGILLARRDDDGALRRSLFPSTQTSPNLAAMMGKAACLSIWTRGSLGAMADRMVRSARLLNRELAGCLGHTVFGGTDCHLLLYDLSPVNKTGLETEQTLESARILANRNQIPGDLGSPWRPSGIRIGTTVPAILHYSDDDIALLAEAMRKATRHDGCDNIVDHLLARYHSGVVSTSSGSTSSP